MKKRTVILGAVGIAAGLAAGYAAGKYLAGKNDAEPRIQEVILKNGDKKIYGKLYLPHDAADKYPFAILSHGFGATHEVNDFYAKFAARNGIACYAFDFCGGGEESKSDGDMSEMSVLTEAYDLSAVIDQVLEMNFVDKENLFLMGESQGGFVSGYVAAKRPDDVAGLVMLYPAFVLQDDAKKHFEGVAELPEYYDFMGHKLGGIYARDAMSFDIYEVLPEYKKDVLIVHGDADTLVPLSYSEKAVDAYGDNAELIVIPDAPHAFRGAFAEEAADEFVDFVERHVV